MTKIIFDIETSGDDFESFDQEFQDYLTKFDETDEFEETRQKLALWAPTAQVVAIGMLNPETDKGVVYFQTDKEEEFEKDNILYKSGDEKQVLSWFWENIKKYNQFITFNGRGFDCPFLMLRSAILQVVPSRNLMPYRYSTDVHIDLLDQLTFLSAYRKFSLDIYCKAFGIKSPKSNGVTGLDVPIMFKDKKYKEIAQYCAGDLSATKEVYERWEKYLNVK